jgi:hypothetical protein
MFAVDFFRLFRVHVHVRAGPLAQVCTMFKGVLVFLAGGDTVLENDEQ